MSRSFLFVLLAATCLHAWAGASSALGPYTIDTITVGGGPYYCAQGSVSKAVINCMNPTMAMPVPSTKTLVGLTELNYDLGKIDDPKNLSSAKVFLYSGELDTVVHRPVMQGLQEYYAALVSSTKGGNITTQFDILSEHMYPTVSYGEACTNLGEPYIGKCNYDGAGFALKALYGELKPSVAQIPANLMQFDQTKFASNAKSLSLNSIGYIYVPTSCQQGATCSLHISFHGCEQSTSDIQEQYPQDIGLNEWAEANDIIVLYPQAIHSDFDPQNPEGCWDWWGYTNSNYAFQSGPQMAFTHSIQQALMGTAL